MLYCLFRGATCQEKGCGWSWFRTYIYFVLILMIVIAVIYGYELYGFMEALRDGLEGLTKA